MGIEEAHLQQEFFRIGECGLQSLPLAGLRLGFGGCGAAPQFVQADRNGIGEVHRGVGLAGLQAQDSPSLQQFCIAQAAVFSAKDQRRWGGGGIRVGGLQPGEGFCRTVQGQGLLLDAAAGGHHAAAIGKGGLKGGEELGLLQQCLAMHGHQTGLIAQVIAAGGDQPQFIHREIGAEARDAAHIQGARRLHQHHRQAHERLWR